MVAARVEGGRESRPGALPTARQEGRVHYGKRLVCPHFAVSQNAGTRQKAAFLPCAKEADTRQNKGTWQKSCLLCAGQLSTRQNAEFAECLLYGTRQRGRTRRNGTWPLHLPCTPLWHTANPNICRVFFLFAVCLDCCTRQIIQKFFDSPLHTFLVSIHFPWDSKLSFCIFLC